MMQALYAQVSDDQYINIRLSAAEVELIQHGLKSLAYAPGYHYEQVLDARTLAERLTSTAYADPGELLPTR
jgi:hypothetical protein